MSKKCRHSWRYRDGRFLDEPTLGEVIVCWNCEARGIESLGPANDSNQEHADEVHAAQIGSISPWTRGADLYIDEDGEISLDFDADGWPWDPTRPVAGQHEEWEARRILDRAMLAGDPATLAESMAERGHIDETIRADLGLVAVDLVVGEEPDPDGLRRAIAGETAARHVERDERSEAVDWRAKAEAARSAIARLLWIPAIEQYECSCYQDSACSLCESARVIGMERWTGSDDIMRRLNELEEARP